VKDHQNRTVLTALRDRVGPLRYEPIVNSATDPVRTVAACPGARQFAGVARIAHWNGVDHDVRLSSHQIPARTRSDPSRSFRRAGLASMARHARAAPGELVYHVLNRAVALLADWVRGVGAPLTARELGLIRICVARGRPYGGWQWQAATIGWLHLRHTVRSEGRPPRPRNQNQLRSCPRPISEKPAPGGTRK